jgi:hypothetical protein
MSLIVCLCYFMSLILVLKINSVTVHVPCHVFYSVTLCPCYIVSLILVSKINAVPVHVLSHVSYSVHVSLRVSDFSFQNK